MPKTQQETIAEEAFLEALANYAEVAGYEMHIDDHGDEECDIETITFNHPAKLIRIE